MYGSWFRKVVKIEETILVGGQPREHIKRTIDFLTKQGYRNRSVMDSTITAVRGRKLWSYAM